MAKQKKKEYLNIAVIIDDMFEDSEYTKPVKAFRIAGMNVTNIGLKKGKEIRGKSKGTKTEIEKDIKDADVKDFDALLIPGGYSPDKLRSKGKAVKFVRKFVESKKPVFAICHGPQLLITAKVLNRRTVTGWKSIVQDIKNAGAKFVDEEVVIDGNLVTSRKPSDLDSFIQVCLKMLNTYYGRREKKMKAVKKNGKIQR